MSKWSLKNRLLQVRLSTYGCIILVLIAVNQFFATPGTYNYPHLPMELIDNKLYKQITPKLQVQKTKPDCKYDEILNSKQSISPWEVPKKFENFNAKSVDNGTYIPLHCNPLFSVAVIVTYRNRQNQLDVFLPYMHDFLRKQNIHYKYVLTYKYLVGGVLAIRTDTYVAVDGFSNRFQGWGGEDDDFSNRLSLHNQEIVRFPREMSRYTMLPHAQEPKNSLRTRLMAANMAKPGGDGLSTLSYHDTRLKNHRLFTLIGVKL